MKDNNGSQPNQVPFVGRHVERLQCLFKRDIEGKGIGVSAHLVDGLPDVLGSKLRKQKEIKVTTKLENLHEEKTYTAWLLSSSRS